MTLKERFEKETGHEVALYVSIGEYLSYYRDWLEEQLEEAEVKIEKIKELVPEDVLIKAEG